MAAVDLTTVSVKGDIASGESKWRARYAIFSIGDITTKKGSAAAAADVVSIVDIAANTLVRNVMCMPITASAAACEHEIGSDSDADGFLTAVDANTAGVIAGVVGALQQKATAPYNMIQATPFASAGTIDITLATSGTLGTVGKLKILWEETDYSHPA